MSITPSNPENDRAAAVKQMQEFADAPDPTPRVCRVHCGRCQAQYERRVPAAIPDMVDGKRTWVTPPDDYPPGWYPTCKHALSFAVVVVVDADGVECAL